jgi:hypothetical protein
VDYGFGGEERQPVNGRLRFGTSHIEDGVKMLLKWKSSLNPARKRIDKSVLIFSLVLFSLGISCPLPALSNETPE